MNYIQPIPTTYKGITYRSKLEARYAVFFDELNLEHSYETFTAKNGYKADFEINSGYYEGDTKIGGKLLVEIKPMAVNENYIRYLENTLIDDTNNQIITLLLFCGNPKTFQENGFHFIKVNNSIYKCQGFELEQCAKTYHLFIAGSDECTCCSNKFDMWNHLERAERIASSYRFDLQHYEL